VIGKEIQAAPGPWRAHIFVVVLLVLSLGIAGCGGGTGGAEKEELADLIEKRLCCFDRPVDLAGGRFTFTGWEWFSEISDGEEVYRPIKGRYVTVSFTFKGSEGGLPEPLNPNLFKLRDSEGRLFYMDEGICTGPARALAERQGRQLPGSLRWDQPGESLSMAMFDVPYETGFLTLVVDGPPGRSSPEDRIELVLEEP